MAKGSALLSKPNLIKTGVTVAVAALVINKLNAAAQNAATKDSIMNKVAGWLGFKGPGVA